MASELTYDPYDPEFAARIVASVREEGNPEPRKRITNVLDPLYITKMLEEFRAEE